VSSWSIIPYSFIYSMLSFFLINLEPAQTESCEETGVSFLKNGGSVFFFFQFSHVAPKVAINHKRI
jgi:hypothetical protein